MAYATATDMINRFDSRTMGDVVSDDGDAATEAELATDSKLAAALASASGEVESAVLAGGMYSITDLAGLTGNAQALLVDLTCSIAMCKLLKRRVSERTEALMKVTCDDAREKLTELRRGDAVFGGTDNATDGTLPETTGPTTVTFNQLNLIRDRTRNYYPRRHLPFDR